MDQMAQAGTLPTEVLCLMNMVVPEDLEDEEEYEGCSCYVHLCSYWIWFFDSCLSTKGVAVDIGFVTCRLGSNLAVTF